jgi:hypothetical protein
MKKFEEIDFDYEQCRTQFEEFQQLLDIKEELTENADIVPFFKDRHQLSLLLGGYNTRIGFADRIAYEFDVFGDFVCDLAVGEWASGSYCFIEFEDALHNSIFEKQGKKATREWSRRFDHGVSQIIDWCHKLHDRTNSVDFVSRFGRQTINYETVLVIGRDRHIDAGERLRLEWRTSYVTVNSKKILCITFDQLLDFFSTRMSLLAKVAKTQKPPEDPGTVPSP